MLPLFGREENLIMMGSHAFGGCELPGVDNGTVGMPSIPATLYMLPSTTGLRGDEKDG